MCVLAFLFVVLYQTRSLSHGTCNVMCVTRNTYYTTGIIHSYCNKIIVIKLRTMIAMIILLTLLTVVIQLVLTRMGNA